MLLIALAVLSVTLAQRDGTECVFSCPASRPVRLPRAEHQPSHNGCGSGGFKVDTSRFPGLEACCNEHDVCYDTCGEARSSCDALFGKCLDKACGRNSECAGVTSMLKVRKGARSARACCDSDIKPRKMGSSMLGCQFYLDSQKQACSCNARSTDKDL